MGVPICQVQNFDTQHRPGQEETPLFPKLEKNESKRASWGHLYGPELPSSGPHAAFLGRLL